MKKAIALLLALVTLLSLTACAGKEDTASSALDQIKQKGELVVGTSADYPPYEFHAEVGGDTSGVQIPFTIYNAGERVKGNWDTTTKAFTELPSSGEQV